MSEQGADWLTAARVMVVAGKGGVGSSTVAAAAAIAAAREGADVMFISVDGRSSSQRVKKPQSLPDSLAITGWL